MVDAAVSIREAMPRERIERLIDELDTAIKLTDKRVLVKWGTKSSRLFLASLTRRGVGFLGAMERSVKYIGKETVDIIGATRKGELRKHVVGRGRDASVMFKVKGNQLVKSVRGIAYRLKSDPATAGIELLVAVLGFYLGSGGLDGDGGVPDLDLKFGIGAHRSILFHSIIAGAAIETAVFSLAYLVNQIHKNLPEKHDRFWDVFVERYNRLSLAFASGACAGIAYHLMMDATLDAGKAYVGLPFSISMAGHQAIMGANAVMEGLDVPKKNINLEE